MTGPSPNPKFHPRHPYTLRGVSTEPHILYVLYPVTSDNDAREYQWWRISYSSIDSRPATKVVSRDMASEQAEALLTSLVEG